MNFWSTAMKIGIEMDLAQGRGLICWEGITWRRVWRLCATVGSLLIAGTLMADRLHLPLTQINVNIAKPAPATGHRPGIAKH